MKKVEKIKKKFIKRCNEKLLKSKKTIKDIKTNTGLSETTINDFFGGKCNTGLDTIIKILNSISCELKV